MFPGIGRPPCMEQKWHRAGNFRLSREDQVGASTGVAWKRSPAPHVHVLHNGALSQAIALARDGQRPLVGGVDVEAHHPAVADLTEHADLPVHLNAAPSARTALVGIHDYMSLPDRLSTQDLVLEVLPRL